jgi:hypothetical protein
MITILLDLLVDETPAAKRKVLPVSLTVRAST